LLGIDENSISSAGTGLTGMTEAPATFEEALAAIANDDDTSKKNDSESTDDLLGLLNLENEGNSEKIDSDELDLGALGIEEESEDTEKTEE